MAATPGSSSGPRPPSRSRASGWASIVRFAVCVFLIASTITVLVRALPGVELSSWKIFRRSASIASALSLWFCITRLERRSIRSYGFAVGKAGKGGVWFGLLLGVATLALLLSLGLITGVCRIAITPDRVKLWLTLLAFVPGAALVGVLEELVFRGYLLQHLLAGSTSVAVFITSVLYAFVHLKTPEWTFHTWLELGGLFLLGAVLAFSYLRTQQLYLAASLHAVLAYGARVNKLLIEFPDLSLSWLTGTSRLVNGLAGWLLLAGIGGVVWWRTRRVEPSRQR